MKHLVVVATEVSSTVAAELRCWLVAAFLVLFELLGTAEAAYVAHFDLLTSLDRGVEGEVRAGNRRRSLERGLGLLSRVSLGSGLLVRL